MRVSFAFGFLLASLLAFSSCQPAVTPSPGASNNQTQLAPSPEERAALSALRSRLSFTAGQLAELRWLNVSNVCGNSTCGVGECAWNGVACRNGNIVRLDISSRVVSSSPLLLIGTLPSQLANLTSLEYFNASGHTPQTFGSVHALDLSLNRLTGKLPSAWAGMSSIVAMNMRGNQLTGSVPQTWAQLPNLEMLDVSDNGICQSSFNSNQVAVRNNNPFLCSSKQVFASSVPTSAPAASAGVSGGQGGPPSSLSTPPPPSNSSFNQSPQQPILQMSTGINIAVSVVIGAFLLFGIVAGAIRVKRQQNAHAAWLQARAEALWQAEREEEAAFQRQLKLMKDPVLSVDPAGEDIAIALPIELKRAPNDDNRPRSSFGGGESSAQTAGNSTGLDSPGGERIEDGEEGRERVDSSTTQARADRPMTREEAERPSPAVAQGAYTWRTGTLRSNRLPRRLPIFVIDAYLTPGGRITFASDEGHWADQERPVRATSAFLVQGEEPGTPAVGRGGGIRNLWSNFRGSKEPTECEGSSTQQQESRPSMGGSPIRESSGTRRAPNATLPSSGSITAGQDPTVAARVRERIDQLRDPDESGRSERYEVGPSPPPPFIRWAPLRRILGMEDVASREARLRRRASQAAREQSITSRAASRV